MELVADQNWSPLGDDMLFRKMELYCMEWGSSVHSLEGLMVVGAPFGGPLALVRGEPGKPLGKPVIFIISSAGRKISSIKWNSGSIFTIGWSNAEDLLCIQEDGTVLAYDLFGQFQRSFGMGQEAKDTKVIGASIFYNGVNTGVAVMTASNRIFLVTNIEDGTRLKKMSDSSDLEGVTCWAILPEQRNIGALISKTRDIHLLDQVSSKQHEQLQFSDDAAEFSSILDMSLSLSGKHVAFFCDNGWLWLGTSNLYTKYCEFNTMNPSKPRQIVWCGSSCVVVAYRNELLLVNPRGESTTFPCEENSWLVQEIDSVRVVGANTHEIIQRVPDVTKDIFWYGSVEPGFLLLEASRLYEDRSYKADEYIRTIGNRLEVAVKQCTEASSFEFQPHMQKMLIKAAQLGKCFIPEVDPEVFVKMCRTLRVLNAVRGYKLGIPLTFNQFEALSAPMLLDRLVLRRQYCLALRIAQYLKLPEEKGASRILAHWACYKVKNSQGDSEVVARTIAHKLGQSPTISYREIANKAAECGRKDLAIRLLDWELRPSEQVPLLLKLGQEAAALKKATDSGDNDLMYTVILYLRDRKPLAEFQMMIRDYSVAHHLYMKLCKEQKNFSLLQDVYHQEDDFIGQAYTRIIESYQSTRVDGRLANLLGAAQCYKQAKEPFWATQCEEQQKLVKWQDDLGMDFTDKPVSVCIYQLLMDRNYKHAEQMSKDFKVPERRYWWLRVQALAELRAWSELEKLSKSKKTSPIGFEPFGEVCLKYGVHDEVKKYLPRMRDESKVKFYVKVGMLEEAARFAYDRKDKYALQFVQSRCGSDNQGLAVNIRYMLSNLQ